MNAQNVVEKKLKLMKYERPVLVLLSFLTFKIEDLQL